MGLSIIIATIIVSLVLVRCYYIAKSRCAAFVNKKIDKCPELWLNYYLIVQLGFYVLCTFIFFLIVTGVSLRVLGLHWNIWVLVIIGVVSIILSWSLYFKQIRNNLLEYSKREILLDASEKEWKEKSKESMSVIKKQIKGILFAVSIAVVILSPTLIFGTVFLYKVFRPVPDITVYITYEGYCYHEDKNCFELKGHSIMEASLDDVKNRKRPCDICCK